MPQVELSYDPDLTKERLLSYLLASPLYGRYQIFKGPWYQGKCIVAAQNGWLGAAINVRQNERKNKTKLEVKRTIPYSRSLAILLVAIILETAALIVALQQHFYGSYVSIFVIIVNLIISQYYGFKERFAVAEVAAFLSANEDLMHR